MGEYSTKPANGEESLLVYPPRAFAVLCRIEPRNGGVLVSAFGSLLDLQHEYPGETFYAIDDFTSTRTLSKREREIKVLQVASTCIAFGVDANKSVLYCLSNVPDPLELLDYIDASGERGQGAYSTSTVISDPAALVALHCLSIRASCLAGGAEILRSQNYARQFTRSLNSSFRKRVLICPRVRISSDSWVLADAVGSPTSFNNLRNEMDFGVAHDGESYVREEAHAGGNDRSLRATWTPGRGSTCVPLLKQWLQSNPHYISDALFEGERLTQLQVRRTLASLRCRG